MLLKCPKCGYAEEVADFNVGDIVECPCGNKYKAGYAKVQPKDFSKVYADVPCPYCEALNALPSEAVNKDVRCGTCGTKFHVEGQAPKYGKIAVTPSDGKENDTPFFRIVFIFLALIFSPLLIIAFAEFSCPLTWVDDDICVAKYTRELTRRDYDAARKWANRIKNDLDRKAALQVIEGTEKGLKAMGLERNKPIHFPY